MNSKVCIFCASPYNIITAVSIVKKMNIIADLYIDPSFQNAKLYADETRKLDLFNNVIYINPQVYEKHFRRIGFIGAHIDALKSYFSPEKIAKDFVIPNAEYNTILCPSNLLLCRVMASSQCKQKNRCHKLEYIYYEEGDMSYIVKPKRIDILLRRIIFGKNYYESKKQLLYSPELYYLLNPNEKIKHERIEIETELNTKLINSVFSGYSDIPITTSMVLLDTLKNVLFDEEGIKRINNIYSQIIDIVGTDNLTVKLHPRDYEEKKSGINYYAHNSIPFEITYLLSNNNLKCIIGFRSTAFMTPKTVFDDEPYLIFLYKLVHAKDSSSFDINSNEQLCNNLKALYKNRERVMIPESIEEMKANLRLVMSTNL